MKIDLKRLEGSRLDSDVDGAVGSERVSLWEGFGFGERPSRYGWIPVAGVPLVIGGICAAVSWSALFSFLGFCAAAMILVGGAVIWIESDSTPFL